LGKMIAVVQTHNSLRDGKKMKKRASDYVVEYIQGQIQSGTWKPGMKIYTETQLQQETGYGKASVREAVERLCAMGILTKHQGDGTYVNDFDMENLFDKLIPNLLLGENDIRAILEYRKMTEPGCVRLLIENYSRKRLQELQDCLDRMKQAAREGNSSALHDADRNFHRVICEGSENSLVIEIMKVLDKVNRRYHYTALHTIGAKSGIEEHEAILKAIRDRDPELGSLLMLRHLERSMRDMEEYICSNSEPPKESALSEQRKDRILCGN